MIVGPESPYFLACARIFRSHAALATSPLVANAANLLMLNSIRDAFFSYVNTAAIMPLKDLSRRLT
jgi:hypothetical protein